MEKNIIKYDELKLEVLGQGEKGQDSIIKYTFDKIETTNKYYIEFGARDGFDCSTTWYLREKCNWKGLLLDARCYENHSINLYNRRITKENICNIFQEFNTPKEFDFISVDIDGFDYWVMKSILEGGYSPRVVMIETNVRFNPYESVVMKYNPEWFWDGKKWWGSSPYAFKKLFNSHNYIPVWICQDDMLVIRKDLLEKNGYEEPDWSYVYPQPNPHIYCDQNYYDRNNFQEV